MSTNYCLERPHSLLRARLDDGVLTVSMGSGQQVPRLDPALIASLAKLMDQASQDPLARVVVLRGAGPHFGAGLDNTACKQMAQHDPAALALALYTLGRWRMSYWRRLAVPVVGLVEGQCLGAALSLVEACDVVLCSDDARFSPVAQDAHWLAREPAAQPCTASPLMPHTTETQDWATPITGRQAQAIGLVTFSHAPEALQHALTELVGKLCEKDPLALRFTKETIAHVGSMSWDAAVSFTAGKFAEIKALQANSASTRTTAIAGFLAGKNKPGLGR